MASIRSMTSPRLTSIGETLFVPRTYVFANAASWYDSNHSKARKNSLVITPASLRAAIHGSDTLTISAITFRRFAALNWHHFHRASPRARWGGHSGLEKKEI